MLVNGSALGFNPYFTGSNSGSRTDQMLRFGTHCFNPYFTGSNSGRYGRIRYLHDWILVSILILLEVILEVGLHKLFVNPAAEFQSLLYWK